MSTCKTGLAGDLLHYTSCSKRENRTEQNRTNMSNACQKFIVKLAHQKLSLNSINYHTVCNSDSCVSSKL